MPAKPVLILAGALAAQALVLYGTFRNEVVPSDRPLAQFPATVGSWQLAQEGVVDQETQALLKADDLLNRTYTNSAQTGANLFVAYFRSQRAGKAPHSPKNCLPGSGWVRERVDTVAVPIEGEHRDITVNRYVVAKGDSRSLVLYWYQSRDRVVASEYAAKVYVVADALKYNRSDTALVRVIVPLPGGDVDRATRTASDFIQAFFPTLRKFLPA